MTEESVYWLIVGQVVRLLRLRRGWIQGVVAQGLGVTKSMMSRLETGQARLDVRQLQALALLFELPPQKLHGLFRDVGDRARQSAAAALQGGVEGDPWWKVVERATGRHGLNGLIAFATAAALHPWPEHTA